MGDDFIVTPGLCGTASGAPSAPTMASKLAQVAEAESVLGQTRSGSLGQRQTTTLADQTAIAELNGLMAEGSSLLSLIGVTPTTLRSVGVIVALVAIVALGKAACFPSARIDTSVGDAVQRTTHIEHDIVSHSSVMSRNKDLLLLDSSVGLSDSDEEIDALDKLFHDFSPLPGLNHGAGSHLTADHVQNHDVHLTGSQFGLDGLPNMERSVHMPSSGCSGAASSRGSSHAELGGGLQPAQLDEIRRITESYHNIDFEYTCNEPRDDDRVSVASMAVLIDRDESQRFH
ncbi:uncharacterized protein PG986_004792 [Apiospora aurea]|uniref:Uncharacterized protein n=1 Tax=Apiospora aurea TaxID=335848 RepID=A0ABR1QNK5_9PEZI